MNSSLHLGLDLVTLHIFVLKGTRYKGSMITSTDDYSTGWQQMALSVAIFAIMAELLTKPKSKSGKEFDL